MKKIINLVFLVSFVFLASCSEILKNTETYQEINESIQEVSAEVSEIKAQVETIKEDGALKTLDKAVANEINNLKEEIKQDLTIENIIFN